MAHHDYTFKISLIASIKYMRIDRCIIKRGSFRIRKIKHTEDFFAILYDSGASFCLLHRKMSVSR